MQLSYRNKKHNKVDYFPLPSGKADVFLHKNEYTEIDEDNNEIHVAEEVYFQVEQGVTREDIEQDFENYWSNKGVYNFSLPTTDDRVDELENIILMLLGGEI